MSVKAGRCFALALFAALVIAAPSEAAFPGTNGKIAYTDCGGVGGCAIWTMDSDGGNAARLTPADEYAGGAAYSADGRQLVFGRSPNSVYYGITLAAPDLSGETDLTTGSTDSGTGDGVPAFSPDGKTIVFNRSSTQTFINEIWSMSSTGGAPTQLSQQLSPATEDTDPAFSPDGKKIAFTYQILSPLGLVGEIDLMDADGSNRVAFTPHWAFTPSPGSPMGWAISMSSTSPDFSPDGSKIVFAQCCDANQHTRIVVAPVTDGSAPTVLTTPDADHFDDSPAFSPDGTQVVFVRRDPTWSASVISSVPATGGEVTPLSSPGFVDDPTWQAAPQSPAPTPEQPTPVTPRVSDKPTTATRPAPNEYRHAHEVGVVTGRRTIVIKGGTARVTLNCPADPGLRCTGTVTLKAKLTPHGRATVIGKAHFRIQPGRKAALTVHLSAAAKRVLRHGGRLKPVAVVSD